MYVMTAILHAALASDQIMGIALIAKLLIFFILIAV